LLDRVEAGEHVVVARGGRPVAELRPAPATQPGPRPFGLCAGAFTVPDDFDAPLPEEILRGSRGDEAAARARPSGTRSMTDDPIVDELHPHREELFREFGNDPDALVRYLQ